MASKVDELEAGKTTPNNASHLDSSSVSNWDYLPRHLSAYQQQHLYYLQASVAVSGIHVYSILPSTYLTDDR